MTPAALPIRQLKRVVFLKLVERLQDLTVGGEPVSTRRTADALWLQARQPDGSLVRIHVGTIKDHMPPGQFALWPVAILEGGAVRAVLDKLPLPPRHMDINGHVVSVNGQIGPRGRSSYRIVASASPNLGAVGTLVSETFAPLLTDFTFRSPRAIDFAIAHPECVARPFSTCVTLALLSGNRSRLGHIHSVAAADRRFWDFREVADPGELVSRIESCLAQSATPL